MSSRARLLPAVSFIAFSRDVLGVKMSPAQRVLYSVLHDGVEPGSLVGEERELARELFGVDVETVPAEARRLVVVWKGARIGASWIGGQVGIWAGLTKDLSKLAPGQTATVAIASPRIQTSKEVFNLARGVVHSTSQLRSLLVAEASEYFTLQRPTDGRQVIYKILPLSAGGADFRGQWFMHVHFSELAFARDENASVNDSDSVNAGLARLLPKCQCLIETTPKEESGLAHNLFVENFGKPTTALVARAPTLLLRGDDPDIVALVAAERRRNPDKASAEFDVEPLIRATGTFITKDEALGCVDRKLEPVTSAPAGVRVSIGCDLAGGSKDSIAFCALHLDESSGVVDVAELKFFRSGKGRVYSFAFMGKEIEVFCGRQGAERAVLDHWNIDQVRVYARGVQLIKLPNGQRDKVGLNLLLRDLLRSRRLRIPGVYGAALVEELCALAVTMTKSSGATIRSPRRGGKHGDAVSALIHALHGLDLGLERDDDEIISIPHTRAFGAGALSSRERGYFDPRYSSERESGSTMCMSSDEYEEEMGDLDADAEPLIASGMRRRW